MGKIVHLYPKSEGPPENVIISKPWEFRKADWPLNHFIQMPKSQCARLESLRQEIHKAGRRYTVPDLPPHFSLHQGTAYTIRAMLFYRDNEERMREVYYLTGLMDCMINQVNPILRTDLLRGMYKKVFTMKKEFNVNWYGPFNKLLLPIDHRFFNELKYHSSLNSARTMKSLYQAIKAGTDKMFDILADNYVFYCPGTGR